MYSNANAKNTKPDLVSQVRLDVKNIVLHMETKGKKIDSSFVCFLDVKHMKFHKWGNQSKFHKKNYNM